MLLLGTQDRPIAPPPTPSVEPATTVTMYDSTNPSDIPLSAQYVAGYVDGLWRWNGSASLPSGAWARFPNAKRITISAIGLAQASFYDREQGDLSAQQAALEIARFPGSGIYCSLSDIPNVKWQVQLYGIPSNQWYLWIAHYTGNPHICNETNGECLIQNRLSPHLLDGLQVVGTQYADPNAGSGGHYDLSLMNALFLTNF